MLGTITLLHRTLLAGLDDQGWETPANARWRTAQVGELALKVTMQDASVTLIVERCSGDRVLGMRLPVDEGSPDAVLDALAAYRDAVKLGDCVAQSEALCRDLSGDLFLAPEPPPTASSAGPELSIEEKVAKLKELSAQRAYQTVKRFDVHLAVLLQQRIVLPARSENEALRRLAALGSTGAPTLDAIFEERGMPLIRDGMHQIVGVEQGGDLWANELLAPIAELLEPSSFVDAVDDEGRFWRWRWSRGRMVISQSRPSAEARHLL